MDNLLEKYIEKLECIVVETEYDKAVQELIQILSENGYTPRFVKLLSKKENISRIHFQIR